MGFQSGKGSKEAFRENLDSGMVNEGRISL